jgi:hypothetical protein
MGVLSLIAKLGLDASGFHRGIKQSESAVSKFGRNATGALKGQLAAAFGTAAFVSATKSLLDYAGKIDDLSFKLGISRSALQEFDYAAAQNSATLDQVTASLAKLSVARMDALRTGNGDIAKAFADLNISVEELKNARLEDLLQKISAAFVEAGDPQQKLGSAIKVLGKSGANLVPVFRASFDAMAAGAHTAGTIIEDETIVKLRKLGDQMTDLKFRSRSLFSELVPVFSLMGRVASQIEAALAATSAFAGSMSYSPSIGQAIDAAAAASASVLNRDSFSSDEKIRAQLDRENLLGMGGDLSFDSTDTAASKAAKKGPGLGFSANSLQQIGAFVGQNPILFESKQQTKVLLKMSKTLDQMERAQRLTGGGFLA